jgi:hypothetical protein
MEVTSKSLIRSAGLGEPWGGDPEMASMGPRPREPKREDFGRVVGYGESTMPGRLGRPMEVVTDEELLCSPQTHRRMES